MEYLQSFLIVVMEMVCFFLFQDAFVPTEKKHKSGFRLLNGGFKQQRVSTAH